MKRVEGKTLREVIDGLGRGDSDMERRFSQQKLLSAFLQVCLAVDYAHSRGIVHRDLKPSNIMLGDFGEVYVLDWGIATASSDSPEIAFGDRPVVESARVGTPGYMAPEQASGKAPPCPTADVYSLGALLFELLALQPLHGGDDAKERLRSTNHGASASLSNRAGHRDIAPEFDSICSRATHGDPTQRFASARELHDAVADFLDGERDLSLRKRLCAQHVAKARQLIPRDGCDVRAASNQQRSAALNQLGRALALAPDDADVQSLLSAILTTPPTESPAPDANFADTAAVSRQKVRAGLGGLLVGWYSVRLPPAYGHQELGMAIVVAVPFFLAGTLLALYPRRAFGKSAYPLAIVALLSAGIVGTTSLGGWALVSPGFAMLVAVIAASLPTARGRIAALALTAASFLVPAVLEWTGIFPRMYEFGDDHLIVTSLAVHAPEALTRLSIIAATLAAMGVIAWYSERSRQANEELRESLALHNWHLQQLVPLATSASDET